MSRVTTVLGNVVSDSCLKGRVDAVAGDEGRQARAVQLALVEVEPPLAHLTRHQHPHQALGQTRHHGPHRGQVLLERLAERGQFVAAGQGGGTDHAVVRGRVGVVALLLDVAAGRLPTA